MNEKEVLPAVGGWCTQTYLLEMELLLHQLFDESSVNWRIMKHPIPLGPSPHLPPSPPHSLNPPQLQRLRILNDRQRVSADFKVLETSVKSLDIFDDAAEHPAAFPPFHPHDGCKKKRNKKEESSRQELMALPTNPSRHLKECQKIPQKILKDPSADVGTRRNVAKESAPLIQLLLSSSWANQSMKSQSIINQHDKLEPFHLSLAGATSLTAS